jgi:DNA-binding NarL/FixJ family response regulator
MKQISILLVDDMPAVRDGLRTLLSLEPDLVVVGEAADGNGAIDAATVLQPDVVVMDYGMAGLNGIEATRILVGAGTGTRVVMLSIRDDAALKRVAAEAGVCSFIAKHEPSSRLVTAIRNAAACQGEEDTS